MQLTVTMRGPSVRRLGWWFLPLAVVYVVDGERLKEHGVKSALCTTKLNPLKMVCYMYDPTQTDQPTALQACERKGGTLAALDTAETTDFVQKEISGEGLAWIGYNEDYAQWYDGSTFNWTNWHDGEPNSADEKCVVIQTSDFLWIDIGCKTKRSSLCQLPGLETQAHATVEEKTKDVTAVSAVPSLPRSERSAESKFRCGQYCLQDPLCGKFNFHPTTLKCALYDVGAVVNEADSSQTFTF